MNFSELGLNTRMVSRLKKLGLNEPTPIQAKAIPRAMQKRDVLGIAQTGTGKTAAFGIPLVVALSKQQERPRPHCARGLILAPTRELAGQIVDNLRGLSADLRIMLVVGGRSISAQANKVARGADILVATPGRLIDLMDRKAIDLSQTGFLVLDEADQMLDMGFIHALQRIAPALNSKRQTMMFSATMPRAMEALSRDHLSDAVLIEVSPPGKAADKVQQSVHFVAKAKKQELLIDLLSLSPDERTLMFSRTKHGADRLTKSLDRAGFNAAAIHGNKTQGQRDRALNSFKTGSTSILVATDVAARGIDIPEVQNVYNFDLPEVATNYVHRIGRTARAGRNGTAVAFCTPDEMKELNAIEKVLGTKIEVASGAPWTSPEQRQTRAPKRHARRRTKRANNRLAA